MYQMYDDSEGLNMIRIIIWLSKSWGNFGCNKQATLTFDGEKFNLRKVYQLEVRKQYQSDSTKRFAALENLSDDENINRAWEIIIENIKTSTKENVVLH